MTKSSLRKTLLATLTLSVLATGAQAKVIKDIANRSVDIPDNVQRVILSDSRIIFGVMPLKKNNSLDKVVGWGDNLMRNDPDTYQKLASKFSKTKMIPVLGNPYKNTTNIESIIRAKPDVYIVDISKYQQAKETRLIQKLDRAGIKTVFIDFRMKPLENTTASMTILGEVFGAQAQAKRFNNYYNQHTAKIYNRVKNIKQSEKPVVFVWRAAGIDPNKCCRTFGSSNYGKFVEAAGGINWGSSKFSAAGGTANPEVLFSDKIDMIVGTGGNWKSHYTNSNAVLLGYNESKRNAKKQLYSLFDNRGWNKINAVKNKEYYAIYHQFYNSPYNFVALEVLAKWMHPEKFKDVNPEASFKDLHDKFLPINYSGTFWVDAK